MTPVKHTPDRLASKACSATPHGSRDSFSTSRSTGDIQRQLLCRVHGQFALHAQLGLAQRALIHVAMCQVH